MKEELKEELINLGKCIKSSKLKQSAKYKNLVNQLSYLEPLEICDKLILLCLQFDSNINCLVLINAMSDYKEKIITEDELRKIVYTVLV